MKESMLVPRKTTLLCLCQKSILLCPYEENMHIMSTMLKHIKGTSKHWCQERALLCSCNIWALPYSLFKREKLSTIVPRKSSSPLPYRICFYRISTDNSNICDLLLLDHLPFTLALRIVSTDVHVYSHRFGKNWVKEYEEYWIENLN